MIRFNIMGLRHALEIRDSRLYSIREMANHAGLSRDTMSNIVRNKTIMLDVGTFSKLVHYFQNQGLIIEVGDFFGWKGEKLVVNIGFLLFRLDSIPTPDNMATETGIPLSRVKNLVRGNVKQIYLRDLAALLAFFRKRGLEIKFGDLLKEEEVDSPQPADTVKPDQNRGSLPPLPPPLTRRQRQKYPSEVFVRAYEEYKSMNDE